MQLMSWFASPALLALLLGVYALIAARSAKRAAEEARDAVYRENLEDELR
jgi:hypothetical protein